LSDDAGVYVTDHAVDVGPAPSWEFEAFRDLDRYLKGHAAPDRRLASEAELVAQVGDWAADRLLGPVAVALAQRPGPVRLVIGANAAPAGTTPDGARGLAFLPWELARVAGRTLAGQKVTFVTDLFPGRPTRTKRDVGEKLRVLGVFSLPEDAGALNLRKERYALALLIQDIATENNRAVELKVLQYGATRRRLEDLLLEERGWDIVHLSGHGLPDGLLLETDTGARDLVTSRELVDLLDASADQIKLITLASCESAAVTATEHLRLLGLAKGSGDGVDEGVDEGVDDDSAADDTGGGTAQPATAADGAAGLPVVAGALVDRLDCAVLAMRFPVVDDFAIDLTGQFFSMVVGKGQPVARALGLALPRALPPDGAVSAGAPALSVGTPTLFGARAVELRLSAPAGGPLVFDAERTKLAAFPDQPERFVGRVGPMTRASTALAPRSGKTGVLFHGMAGAGKTACALELAYSHEDSFQRLVWYPGPQIDSDVAAAFTGLALALEGQLTGLSMVHLVDNPVALAGFLPTLTEFLQQQRVLLVLDNLEHLLTDDGQWRDPRWEQLVTAVTGHKGSSRVIMTSRTRPKTVAPGVLVEPVHALSLPESVLLAREFPHLRALLDTATPDAADGAAAGPAGPGSSRAVSGQDASALLVRTLTVVQGLPKLIEMADGQAGDPAALAARLDDADRAWLQTGTKLQTFLDTGEPTATSEDYLTVLAGWTRAAAADLPDPAAALLALLACLQDDDRTPFVLEQLWPHAWTALGHPDDAPPLQQALAPLLDHALITTDTTTVADSAPDANGGSAQPPEYRVTGYRVHPGVADAIRDATPADTTSALEDLAAEFWQAILNQALQGEGEGLGRMVLTAARSAIPYLARRRHWSDLSLVAQMVLVRDNSPLTAAALVTLLKTAADATTGTDDELAVGRTYATALSRVRPDQAEPLLQAMLETATTHGDHGLASVIASDLIILYRDAGLFEKALALVEIKKEHTQQAGHGPWAQLSDEGRRLQILTFQGRSPEVLDEVNRLRTHMDSLPPDGDPDRAVDPFNVREALLGVGRNAAAELGRWQDAFDLNAAVLDSKRERGAPEREIAWSAYNDYAPLLRLGRLDEARDLLRWCRQVAEASDDVRFLAKVIGAQADLEDQLGHPEAAARLGKDNLRLSYAVREPGDVAASHYNLAGYLKRTGAPVDQQWAHRIAGAVITYQTGEGSIDQDLLGLAQLLAGAGEEAPATFTHVCAIVDQVEGVHLARLLARIPARASDPDTAMAQVLAAARALPRSPMSVDNYIRKWEPFISALVAAARGDTQAATVLDAALEAPAKSTDWQALAGALRRVAAGDRDADSLTVGLDQIDTAILTRTLAALDGTQPINPDAWHALTEQPVSEQGGIAPTGADDEDGDLASFVGAVAAATLGDADAAAALDSWLDEASDDADLAPLVAAVRRTLGGERDPDTLTRELDPESADIITAILDQVAAASVSMPAPVDTDD
jgi:hypothetical protein